MATTRFGIKLSVEGAKSSQEDIRRLSDEVARLKGEVERLSGGINAAAGGGKGGNAWRGMAADVAHVATGIGAAVHTAQAMASAVSGIAHATIDARLAAEKLKNSLEFSTGGLAAAGKEIEYLRGVTRTMGLDFATASQAYAKFAASARGAGMSMVDVRATFEGVSQAGARFGLSADEMNGAFLALGQMASKGVVAMEELRGQLGERLPGAFNLAAKAMGMTQAELIKMVESGKLAASEFLPRFAQALKEIEAPANSLQQNLNRISSAWDVWKQSMVSADGSSLDFLTRGLNESSAAMRELGEDAGVVHKLLVAIGGFSFGMANAGRFDTQQMQDNTRARLAEIARSQHEYERLKDKNDGYLSPVMRDALKSLDAEAARLRRLMAELAMQRGKEVGFQSPGLKGQFEAQKKAEGDRVKAYLVDDQYAPKAAKIARAIEEENAKFAAAVGEMDKTDQRYMALLKAHNERLTAIRAQGESGKGDGGSAASQKALIATLEGRLAVNAALADSTVTLTETEKQYTAWLAASKGANNARIDGLYKQVIAQEKAQAAEQAWLKLEVEADSRREAGLKALADETAKIQAGTTQMQEQIAVLLGGKEATRAMADARLQDAIAAEEQRLRILETNDIQSEETAAIREKIKALQEQRDMLGQLGDAEVIARQREEWQKFMDDIERSLTDALMRGFESGKSFGKSFIDSLKNTLKTAALKVAVQAIVAPVMGGVNSAFGQTAEQGGSGSNLMSMASNANTAYKVLSNGSTLLSGGTGSAFDSLYSSSLHGTALGTFGESALISMGNGAGFMANTAEGLQLIQGGNVASGMGSIAGAAAPYLSALTFGQKYGAVGGMAAGAGTVALGGALSGAGAMSALSAMGPAGWAAMAALAIGGSMMKKRGGPQQGGWGTLGSDGEIKTQDHYSGGDSLDNKTLLTSAYNQAAILFKMAGRNTSGLQVAQGYRLDPQGTAPGIANRQIDIDGVRLTGNGGLTDSMVSWRGGNNDAQGAATYLAKLTSSEIDAIASALNDSKLNGIIANLKKDFGDLADGMAQYQTAQAIQKQMLNAVLTTEEAEKKRVNDATEMLNSVMGNLGKSVPQTTVEFRALIEGLDMSTKAGQEMLGNLAAMGDAFIIVAEAAKAAAEKTHELARSQVENAEQQLRSAFEAERSRIEGLRDAFKGLGESLKKFRESLLTSQYSPLNPSQRYAEALAQFDDTRRKAALGDVDAMGKMESVSQTLLDVSRTMYSSGEQYTTDFSKVQEALANTESVAQRQMTIADSQLQALRSQVSALIDIRSSTLSIAEAMAALKFSQDNNRLPSGGAGTPTSQDAATRMVLDAYASIGRTSEGVGAKGIDTEGFNYWMQRLGSGELASGQFNSTFLWAAANAANADMESRQRAQALMGLPKFATGGMHSGGARMVGERGWEVEVTGPARIYTAAQTGQMLATGSAEVTNELRQLRAEIVELRRQQNVEHQQNVQALYGSAQMNADEVGRSQSESARRQQAEVKYA